MKLSESLRLLNEEFADDFLDDFPDSVPSECSGGFSGVGMLLKSRR